MVIYCMFLWESVEWRLHYWKLKTIYLLVLLSVVPALVLWQPRKEDLMPFLRLHRRREYIKLRAIAMEVCSLFED